MQTYVIRRRSNWATAEELGITAGISARVGNQEMAGRVRWIRSYVVNELDGRLGTVCIYQAVDETAIREHANRAGMTADEVLPVENTVVVREDPLPEAHFEAA
jgi:thiamine biosynthesis protein ThiC